MAFVSSSRVKIPKGCIGVETRYAGYQVWPAGTAHPGLESKLFILYDGEECRVEGRKTADSPAGEMMRKTQGTVTNRRGKSIVSVYEVGDWWIPDQS